MVERKPSVDVISERLAALFSQPFGGKPEGRYRISSKLLRRLAGRRRLYEDDIREISRALSERGFVLVDMDAYFVVLSAATFTNYRRANEQSVDS